MFQPSQPARRSRVRSAIALGLAAVAVAVTAGACGGGSSGLGSPDHPSLKVGLVESIGAVPFQIGTSTSQHSFMDAGLTITVLKFDTQAQELDALAKGNIDIAYGEYAQFLSSSSQLANNNDIRVVSEGYDANSGTIGLVTRPGTTMPNWGQGHPFECDGSFTIVVPTKQSIEYLALAGWLASLGPPLPSDCRAIKENDKPSQAIGGVSAGQYSAAVLQEPYVTGSQVNAGLELSQDLVTGNAAAVPVDGYFATKEFVKSYPKTTAIFASVMAKLQTESSERVIVEQALQQSKTVDPKVIAMMQLGSFPSVVLPAKLDIVLRLMLDAGTINGPMDSAKLTDLNN
jgi:NitT/TauT family transport system substrate-binding protein